jgi:acyl carrier protein
MAERKIENLIIETITSLDSGFEAVELNESTPLFGKDAIVDSLSLVSLIVDIEQSLSLDYHVDICLTDDRAMTREVSPFETIGSLTHYIEELIQEKA